MAKKQQARSNETPTPKSAVPICGFCAEMLMDAGHQLTTVDGPALSGCAFCKPTGLFKVWIYNVYGAYGPAFRA